jgi:hypothetical protein
MEVVEWTKVKETHRGDTLRNPFELINLDIKNER